ncbi:hypothetical protein GQ42DRAFT_162885 [Ramicandelaber brevisporus]|nr:hypothetical protein GQ42DRAFT_162885 [Ramicandelaber brevisporus]
MSTATATNTATTGESSAPAAAATAATTAATTATNATTTTAATTDIAIDQSQFSFTADTMRILQKLGENPEPTRRVVPDIDQLFQRLKAAQSTLNALPGATLNEEAQLKLYRQRAKRLREWQAKLASFEALDLVNSIDDNEDVV